MLVDGIQLISTTSILSNVNLEHGTAFPTTGLAEGREFYLTIDITNFDKGLYLYDGNAWQAVDQKGALTYTPEDVANRDTANGYPSLDGTAKIRNASLQSTVELNTNKDAVNGYAGLDSNGKIAASQLPSIAITDVFTVASQAAMLSLTAQTGDVAIRSDLNKSYILAADTPTVLSAWKELLTPTDSVTSVNGQTGAVTISAGVTSVNGQTGAVTVPVPYDISGYVPAFPAASAKILLFTTTRTYQIPANFTGSLAKSDIAPTATVVYTIYKNGSAIATMTFAAGSNSGTFSTQAAVSFASGDILSVTAPVVIDTTHQEIMFTFICALT